MGAVAFRAAAGWTATQMNMRRRNGYPLGNFRWWVVCGRFGSCFPLRRTRNCSSLIDSCGLCFLFGHLGSLSLLRSVGFDYCLFGDFRFGFLLNASYSRSGHRRRRTCGPRRQRLQWFNILRQDLGAGEPDSALPATDHPRAQQHPFNDTAPAAVKLCIAAGRTSRLIAFPGICGGLLISFLRGPYLGTPQPPFPIRQPQ